MPAMLDDPTSPPIYRRSGNPPYPNARDGLPAGISPRHVILRDRTTAATLLPFSSPDEVPQSLLSYLCDQLNREIEKGDTYPMLDTMALEKFGPYWFANFGAIMLLGSYENIDHLASVQEETNWEKACLGSFYVKPNYPGRSSHVCNGGFLVTGASRNKGVGRLMGEGYLEWAPKLGYTYSVFNLVYETNVASCRIWDALGFKRIGRVPGCGNLRSHPDELIDAIIYGRELGPESDEIVTEERFDKIRFYLQHGKYPNGADRAEKSRLRSAATHYKLMHSDDPNSPKLMLKGKEVISDPQRQYEIARALHGTQHGGINKTTATIADKYHWVRIKETVSMVIRNCTECKELSKSENARVYGSIADYQTSENFQPSVQARELSLPLPSQHGSEYDNSILASFAAQETAEAQETPINVNRLLESPTEHGHPFDPVDSFPFDTRLPAVDPRLMQDMQPSFSAYSTAFRHEAPGQSTATSRDPYIDTLDNLPVSPAARAISLGTGMSQPFPTGMGENTTEISNARIIQKTDYGGEDSARYHAKHSELDGRFGSSYNHPDEPDGAAYR